MLKRNQIVYIPFPVKGNKINEYTTNMVSILKQKYEMLANLAEPTNIIQMLRTKAVFLNWVENDLDSKTKVKIFLHRVFGAKIIWVFHNKYPHDCDNSEKIISDMKWLADNSSVILLHAKSSRKLIPNYKKNVKKAVYVPHVKYEVEHDGGKLPQIRADYSISEHDFVFLIFGGISPYKNIEYAIEIFNRKNFNNTKLIIAGRPLNQEYANDLLKRANGNDNIIFDFRYIPNKLLDQLIALSNVVLIPYKNGSSINSGVMIQAFSAGKTVIAPDMCMTRDFLKQRFLYAYKRDLEKAICNSIENGKSVNTEMGSRALKYMNEHHDPKTVGKILFNIIEKNKRSE